MATHQRELPKLQAGYLFPEIGRRVRAFSEANPVGARDPARHRRRDAAARARDRRRDARGVHRDGHRGGLPRLRPRATATTSCSTRSASTTTARAASRSPPTRSSSPTAASRTAGTSRRSSAPARIVRGDRPGLSGLRRHERDGGPHRRRRRAGTLCGHHLSARDRAQRLRARPAGSTGRDRLPLLAQQPDRRGDDPRAARGWVAWARGTTPC